MTKCVVWLPSTKELVGYASLSNSQQLSLLENPIRPAGTLKTKIQGDRRYYSPLADCRLL